MRIRRGFAGRILCLLLFFFWASDAAARKIPYSGEMSDIEWASWPPYCQAIASRRYKGSQRLMSKEEEQKWARILGKAFEHVHHYCDGLLMRFRLDRPIYRSQGGKIGGRGSIGDTIDYTWSRTPVGNPLYAKMGADLMLEWQYQGDLKAAESVMTALFQNRPDSPYTYTGVAEFYRRQGEPKRAIEVLEIGAKKVEKNRRILAELAQDYFDLKQYEKSRETLRLARAKGAKLRRLGKALEEVGFPISSE